MYQKRIYMLLTVSFVAVMMAGVIWELTHYDNPHITATLDGHYLVYGVSSKHVAEKHQLNESRIIDIDSGLDVTAPTVLHQYLILP